MQIELSGEAEYLLKAALASGQFASAEEFVTKMAMQFSRTISEQRGQLRKPVDIDTLASEQVVGPLQDYRDLKADFWNKDDSVDAFVQEIRSVRDQDTIRVF